MIKWCFLNLISFYPSLIFIFSIIWTFSSSPYISPREINSYIWPQSLQFITIKLWLSRPPSSGFFKYPDLFLWSNFIWILIHHIWDWKQIFFYQTKNMGLNSHWNWIYSTFRSCQMFFLMLLLISI